MGKAETFFYFLGQLIRLLRVTPTLKLISICSVIMGEEKKEETEMKTHSYKSAMYFSDT